MAPEEDWTGAVRMKWIKFGKFPDEEVNKLRPFSSEFWQKFFVVGVREDFSFYFSCVNFLGASCMGS